MKYSGSPKWSTSKKTFTVLKLSDDREVFLHRDDFEGEWPPRYLANVEFDELVATPTQRCKWRAKDARLVEAK